MGKKNYGPYMHAEQEISKATGGVDTKKLNKLLFKLVEETKFDTASTSMLMEKFEEGLEPRETAFIAAQLLLLFTKQTEMNVERLSDTIFERYMATKKGEDEDDFVDSIVISNVDIEQGNFPEGMPKGLIQKLKGIHASVEKGELVPGGDWGDIYAEKGLDIKLRKVEKPKAKLIGGEGGDA